MFYYEGSLDVARLGAQVISGVGFLGVGTIIVTGRNQVRVLRQQQACGDAPASDLLSVSVLLMELL